MRNPHPCWDKMSRPGQITEKEKLIYTFIHKHHDLDFISFLLRDSDKDKYKGKMPVLTV